MSNFFSDYEISSPFGWRDDPLASGKEFHTGIDLVKENEGPIYAFVPGEVIHARFGEKGTGFGGFGNVVAIKDENGHLHCYCHLSHIVVKEGQRVDKGQMIGREGSTGSSTGPHLHYEIRKYGETSAPYGWRADKEGNYFNPEEYLSKYFQEATFSDVAKGNTHYENIKRAKDLNLLMGFPDGSFHPKEPLTREEAATVSVNIYDAILKELKK